MPCSGAPGEACGGPNRLSVYEKAASTGGDAPAAAGPNGWGSLGCYSDSVAARILPNVGIVNGGPANMSAASCTDACSAANYKYAGTEYGGECFCGNTLGNGHTKQEDGCDMHCNGAATEWCGGANRINIYEFGATAPVQTGWVSQGCYTDSVAQRTFQVGMGVDGGAAGMSNTKCQVACRAAGYIWAGTEVSYLTLHCTDTDANKEISTLLNASATTKSALQAVLLQMAPRAATCSATVTRPRSAVVPTASLPSSS